MNKLILLFLFLLLVPFVSAIGYEDTGDYIILYNEMERYYIEKDSGVQFSQTIPKYYAKNVFCGIGNSTNPDRNIMICADEVGLDFDYVTKHGDESVEAQWSYNHRMPGNKFLEFTVHYNLTANHSHLFITPKAEHNFNPLTHVEGSFLWKFIEINITGEGKDFVFINETEHILSETNMEFKPEDIMFDGFSVMGSNGNYFHLNFPENDTWITIDSDISTLTSLGQVTGELSATYSYFDPVGDCTLFGEDKDLKCLGNGFFRSGRDSSLLNSAVENTRRTYVFNYSGVEKIPIQFTTCFTGTSGNFKLNSTLNYADGSGNPNGTILAQHEHTPSDGCLTITWSSILHQFGNITNGTTYVLQLSTESTDPPLGLTGETTTLQYINPRVREDVKQYQQTNNDISQVKRCCAGGRYLIDSDASPLFSISGNNSNNELIWYGQNWDGIVSFAVQNNNVAGQTFISDGDYLIYGIRVKIAKVFGVSTGDAFYDFINRDNGTSLQTGILANMGNIPSLAGSKYTDKIFNLTGEKNITLEKGVEYNIKVFSNTSALLVLQGTLVNAFGGGSDYNVTWFSNRSLAYSSSDNDSSIHNDGLGADLMFQMYYVNSTGPEPPIIVHVSQQQFWDLMLILGFVGAAVIFMLLGFALRDKEKSSPIPNIFLTFCKIILFSMALFMLILGSATSYQIIDKNMTSSPGQQNLTVLIGSQNSLVTYGSVFMMVLMTGMFVVMLFLLVPKFLEKRR